ncbi:ABC transporter ATP-binding protein [Schumannella soli]|nr:ABC transporter ATP-binding protein [Schumannella soli]
MTSSSPTMRTASADPVGPADTGGATGRTGAGLGVDASGLRLGYGRTEIVHDVALRLEAGQVTALIGPNGSGKSTVLRALARLHAPTHGAMTLDDGRALDTLARREFARTLTLLSQSRPAPSGLSVREVVEFGRHPHRGRFRSADPDGAAAVQEALELTGLTDIADAGVDELSGGQLQRVWLATSLAQRTGVLLLDEPTNHLDLRYQVETIDLVRELADEHGITVGIVLHDLDQAAVVADRLVLLSEGRVVADGPADEVLRGELLSEVYGIRIDVDADPATGALRTKAFGHRRRSRAAASASA